MKGFLYCSTHKGLVPNKFIDMVEGIASGREWPECEDHPDAEELQILSFEEVKDKYEFTVLEDREKFQ